MTANVTCYFDETGEFWFLHGNAIHVASAGSFLAIDGLLRGWYAALRSSLTVLDKFGALPTRKVELGVNGLTGVRWPGDISAGQPIARKALAYVERQQRKWGAEEQLDLLTDASNRIRDVFALEKVDASHLKQLLNMPA